MNSNDEELEFIRGISEAIKTGLEEFFAEWCRIAVFTPPHEDSSIVVAVTNPESPRRPESEICRVVLQNDHAVIWTPPKEQHMSISHSESHEYCHPQFPDSVIHALSRILNRSERLEQFKKEAIEEADQNPEEGVNYFIATCQKDPLLSRFISDNFAVVLKFQMTEDRHNKKAVTEWINNWQLPQIEELCG